MAHIIGSHTDYAAGLTAIKATLRAAVFYRRALCFKRATMPGADDGVAHSVLNPFKWLRMKGAATW
jgi:hypothetical protein